MRLCFIILGLIFSAGASAQQSCPRLEGRFACRGPSPFELEIRQGLQNGWTVYTFTDPTASQYIVPDGGVHEMTFRDGKGTYIARCQGTRLLVEVHGPAGGVGYDQYYIERAGLVRVRMSPGAPPQSLSCKPIGGTWNLYPH